MSIFAIWNSLFWPKGYTSNLFYYLLSSCCLPDMITMWTPLYVTDRITECEHHCILYTVSQNVNTPVCYRHDQRMWTPLYVTDRITECEHPCILYIEWQNVTMRVYYIQKENVNTLAYYRQNHRMWTPCILHTETEPYNVNTPVYYQTTMLQIIIFLYPFCYIYKLFNQSHSNMWVVCTFFWP